MKSITSFLAVLALGSTLSFAADEKPAAPAKPDAAAPAKPKPDPAVVFKKLDTNNDGKLSSEEYLASPSAKKDLAKAEAAFAKKDKDSDKNLTLEEFSAVAKKKN